MLEPHAKQIVVTLSFEGVPNLYLLDTQVALRSKDLSSPLHYLQLAQFCHEHGREDDALRHAEEGLWVFEDARPDERLLFFTVERLVQAGRKKDAQAHLGRAFEAAPSVELYARLAKIGGKDVAQQARERLEAKVAVQERTRWNSPADLLVNVFAREEMWDAAWKAAHKYGVSMAVKQTLAHASESAFPGEAVAAYAERVDQLAETGGNPAYEEAARFVARMSRLQDRVEQLAYVQALKVRHGRKRNFMKLLG